MKKMEDLPEGKLILFWIIGAIAIVFGAWIAGHVEYTLGTSAGSYTLAIIISIFLVMLGGLSWIAVSVTVSQEKEIEIESVKKARKH